MEHDSQPVDRGDASTSRGSNTASTKPIIKKFLRYNAFGLAIGKDAAKVTSTLGNLVRTNISIRHKIWKEVPDGAKGGVWDSMKEEFNLVDAQRDMYMRKADLAWKKYKCRLRKHFKGNDVNTWIAAKPKRVTHEDWYQFCVNESDEAQLALRMRNKNIRNDTPLRSTHNTGRYGYAQAEEKFKEAYGRKPMLVELWLYTHKRKDGTYAAHDQENAVKFQGMVDVMLQKGEQDTIDSGPLFDAFGVNKRGGTRCVSSVISRKAVLASSFAIHLFQEMDGQRQDINATMTTLHEDNEKLKQQMNELVEGLRSGTFAVHRTNQSSYVPCVGGSSRANSSRPSPSTVPQEIPCAILSHDRNIVGYGRKSPPGSVERVHGHSLKIIEARVVLDAIHDHSYPLWGGEQFGYKLLGELSIGSFLYWLDDLLPPLDID